MDGLFDMIVILVGVFVDFGFLVLGVLVFEECKYGWVVMLVDIEY